MRHGLSLPIALGRLKVIDTISQHSIQEIKAIIDVSRTDLNMRIECI